MKCLEIFINIYSKVYDSSLFIYDSLLISDVIRIERPGGSVQFSPEKSPLPYLIVPLDCENGIEWNIDWIFLVNYLADRVKCDTAHAYDKRVRKNVYNIQSNL